MRYTKTKLEKILESGLGSIDNIFNKLDSDLTDLASEYESKPLFDFKSLYDGLSSPSSLRDSRISKRAYIDLMAIENARGARYSQIGGIQSWK